MSTIRKSQLEFCGSHEGLLWIKEVIGRKLDNAKALLFMVDVSDPLERRKFDNSIAKIDSYKRRLDGIDGESVANFSGAKLDELPVDAAH